MKTFIWLNRTVGFVLNTPSGLVAQGAMIVVIIFLLAIQARKKDLPDKID